MSAPRRTLVVLALALAALALWLALRSRRHALAPPPVAAHTEPVAPPAHTASSPTLVLSTALALPDDTARNGALEGRVVSSSDGHGITGAAITFEHRGATSTAVSATDGRFAFVPSDPGRYEVISVVADGFVSFEPALGHSGMAFVAEAGQRVRDVVLTLEATVEYTGTVQDLEGAPIDGAEVRVVRDDDHENTAIARSDGRGHFVFRAGNQAVIRATHAGYDDATTVLDFSARLNRHVVIRMPPSDPDDDADAPADALTAAPPEQIAGSVLDPAGDPVEGTVVFARSVGEGAARSVGRATSGSDGRFAIRGLEPGEFVVTARGDGFTEVRAEHVRASTTDLVLRLPGGARLRGTVRDAATGRAVAGFTVLLARRDGPLARSRGAPTSVFDALGRYAVTPLAPGEYAVSVIASGYAPSDEQTVAVRDAAAGELVADFALARGGRVRGTVLDASTHRPVAGARVELESSVGSDDAQLPVSSATATDAQGSFELAGLAPGPHSLLVSAQQFNGRIVSGIDPRGGDAPAVTIELTPTLPGQDPRVELVGIGAMLAMRGDALWVTSVVAGGGASAAGIAAGDAIASVDGTPVTALGFEGAVQHIRGPEGTTVTLGVRHGTADATDIQVARMRVQTQ